MNSRLIIGIIIAVIGLLLVGLGIFMAMQMLTATATDLAAQATPQVETTISVVVVKGDIPAGTLLDAADVEIRDVPIEFTPRDTLMMTDQAIGKITKVDLYQGEMVLEHNLADPTNNVFDVAYVLDDTHVLMALPATDLMSRESIIQQGDIIDILVTYTELVERAADEDEIAETGDEDATVEKVEPVTFAVKQRVDITALVVDIVRTEETPADGIAQSGIPRRDQIVVQTYLVALDPQDALILKYLKDVGGVFDYVIRAPTSTGQFDLTPVTSEYLRELYGLELLP